MDIRNVSIDDFLVWPDDRPTDGDMIRGFTAAGRSRDEWLFIGYVDGVPALRIGYRTSPFMSDPTRSGSLPATRLFGIGREGRGNGYANDLVRYGTKLAIEAGWSMPIRAQTDLVNVPMRTAFTSHGYEEEPGSRTWGHLLNFNPDHTD